MFQSTITQIYPSAPSLFKKTFRIQCFMAPPRFGRAGLGGRAHLPTPQKKFLGGRAPPPQKDGALTSCGGGKRAIFAPKSGQKWPNFPARAKGAHGIPQRAYNSLQIGSNLRKNGSKTQKLLQKWPWWRKSVHIASKNAKKRPQSTFKTALRAPKTRAKNFPQNLAPPPEFLSGGGRAPLAGETPTWNTEIYINPCS